jgi:DNA mismatch endonuclease, patch repair protein
MSDVLTPEQRRRCMTAIRGKDTKPEIAVRSMLDTLKMKYDLHRPDLPGKPDIVLARRKKIIFVHGCFWHAHNCRYGRVKPTSNASFWSEKRGNTRQRDVFSIEQTSATLCKAVQSTFRIPPLRHSPKTIHIVWPTIFQMMKTGLSCAK